MLHHSSIKLQEHYEFQKYNQFRFRNLSASSAQTSDPWIADRFRSAKQHLGSTALEFSKMPVRNEISKLSVDREY